MPKRVTSDVLDRIIATTTPPEEFPNLPPTAALNLTLPVVREINAALRELKRARKYIADIKAGKIGHYGPG